MLMEENSLNHTNEPKWQARAHFQPASTSKQIHVITARSWGKYWKWTVPTKQSSSHELGRYLWVKRKVSHNSCNKLITVYTSCKSGQKLLSLVGRTRGGPQISCLVRRTTTSISFSLHLFFSLLTVIYCSLACKPRKVEK